ncbi:MAG TPA: hypothetical protein PKA05_06450, partial [Roseiflexaceae bacterium]|nr:hypothetical protein [Roseiflexaceae bacterium]
RAIALAGIELPQASTPPPLPLWLVPILIVLAGGAGIMAYGTFVRATWVFYAACSVAVLLIVAAVAVSLLIGGPIVLMVSFAPLIMAILIGLGYIVVADDLFGEDQLVVYAPRGIHGRDLFIEGQAHAAAGRFFVAAQCWARAVAREPGNAEYLHALGLTLARLGQHAAALAALQRAHAAAPGRSDIITSIETVTKETIHGWK